jgi:PAB-dependent poly(A)-specific ribonuclease subunit 2
MPSTAPIACVRRSNLVACGQADGRIVLRDPRSLRPEQTITAHTNGLSALEVQGNYLLSIGYTIRCVIFVVCRAEKGAGTDKSPTSHRQGVPVVDPLVKVFDIRARRPLPPVSFPSIPSFIKPHPRNNSMLFVASAQGHFQLADLSNPAAIEFYTTETNSYLTSMAVAPTGQGLAFSDADGIVDIWSAAPAEEEPVFTRFTNPIEIPDPPEPPKHVNWTPETPLSVIGMPYYDSQLFSYLPLSAYSSIYSPFGQPPKPIDPAILATMKTVRAPSALTCQAGKY